VAAAVNGAIVLSIPVVIAVASYLGADYDGTVTAWASPPHVIAFRWLRGALSVMAPAAAFAAVAAWRTWVHAVRYRQRRGTGWDGVFEAGALGLAGAVVVLLPGIVRSPGEAPAFVVAYGGMAMFAGLALGLVLRTVAVIVLNRR
jgi:hypothetical protein